MANIELIKDNPNNKVETDLRRKLIERGYYGAAISVGKGFLYPGSPVMTLWIQSHDNRNHQTILMIDGEKFIKQAKKPYREWRKMAMFAMVAANQGDKKSFDEIMKSLRDRYDVSPLDTDERMKELLRQIKRLKKLRDTETEQEAIDRLNAELDACEEALEVAKDIGIAEKCSGGAMVDMPGIAKEVSTSMLARDGAPLDPKEYVNGDKAS